VDQSKPIVSLGEYLPEYLESLNSGNTPTGIPTGFKSLDDIIDGLPLVGLSVFAGQPSAGKTSICLQIARHAAKTGCLSFIVGVEHGIQYYAERILSQEAGVSGKVIRHSLEITDKKIKKQLLDASVRISEFGSNLFIINANSMPLSVTAIRDIIEPFGADKPKLIVIDSIQALSFSSAARTENCIDGVIREVSQYLSGSSVLCISRTSKSSSKSTSLDGLAFSYGLAFDSHLVMFLQNTKTKIQSSQVEVELVISKNTRGPAKVSIPLLLNTEVGAFSE